MSGTRFLALFFSLLFIACSPPEEPSDTDESNDSDTPVTDIDPDEQINFPDPVLRACVEKLIYGKNPGDPIYAKDVTDITKVDCDGVSDLTGMEYLAKTEWVIFYESGINSLKPLSALYNLKYLRLRGGGVRSFNEISELNNIVDIEYMYSDLEDISALSDMDNLEWVYFVETKIKSMAALSSLPSIQKIRLSNNPALTTLGAQFTAPKLQTLNVSNCGLTSLNELSGLPELTSIAAGDNYLTDISFITTIPKLESIGIGGNCLSESEVQKFVDWWNTKYPEYPKTIEEEMQWQTPEKCQ